MLREYFALQCQFILFIFLKKKKKSKRGMKKIPERSVFLSLKPKIKEFFGIVTAKKLVKESHSKVLAQGFLEKQRQNFITVVLAVDVEAKQSRCQKGI
jgi:hypothetical protein